MVTNFLRTICLLSLLQGTVYAQVGYEQRTPYPPKLGEPHPPLALWNLEHDDYISVTHFRGKKVLLIHFAVWSKECREQVPAWYETLRKEVDAGKLVIVGVIQDQHPDRARLFAQWKNLDGPMMQDPVNYMRISQLPLIVGMDENGYVRAVDPDLKTVAQQFVARTFPGEPALIPANTEEPHNTVVTRRFALEAKTSIPYIDHGDAVLIAGLSAVYGEAIEVYGKATADDRRRADAWFGLGVAHRMRFESEHWQAGDFQAAVDAWGRAVRLAPKNEIYQRRLEQYAPPVQEPYPLYDWVDTARQEIAARGDTPLALSVEPMGAELGGMTHRRGETATATRGDPNGKVKRDERPLIRIDQTIVRSIEKSRPNVWQVYLTFRPDPQRAGRWCNESEPLRVWLRRPGGAQLQPRYREFVNPSVADSDEPRTVCFTVTLAEGARRRIAIKGYALYHLLDQDGKSAPRRQDFEINIRR